MTERKGLLNSLVVENFSLLLTDNFAMEDSQAGLAERQW